MSPFDKIAEACRVYGRLNLIVERFEKRGKQAPYFVTGALESATKRMEALWADTGLNMITACDLRLTQYLLHPSNGYINIALVPHRNICAIKRMAYGVGIFYDIDRVGSAGRYCYHSMAEAVEAFNNWGGDGHPPGNWLKHFSLTVEEINLNYNKDSTYSS